MARQLAAGLLKLLSRVPATVGGTCQLLPTLLAGAKNDSAVTHEEGGRGLVEGLAGRTELALGLARCLLEGRLQ